MSNRLNTSIELRTALAQCIGSERWFRHPLVRTCLYTEGAQMFAEMAGAYWFLDILATELVTRQHEQEFMLVRLAVADSKATITAEDGNGNAFWSRAIEFTDCPAGEWRFYITNRTILLPSEY